MSNMSYCRFQNTVNDLEDCLEAIRNGDELSDDEEHAKRRLIDICQDILDEAKS